MHDTKLKTALKITNQCYDDIRNFSNIKCCNEIFEGSLK